MLFSSNTYRKLEKHFQILNTPWVLKSRYYYMLDNMLSVTNEVQKREQSQIISASKQIGLILNEDRRRDSPGHNVKYLIYPLFDQSLKMALAVSLTQATEVDSVSNRMEKAGLLHFRHLIFDYFCSTFSYCSSLFTFCSHKCFYKIFFFIFVYTRTLQKLFYSSV